MTHLMKLRKEPFDLMASGKKQYEFRLYDEKRRKILKGDSIIFTCPQGRELVALVKDIITASDWKELDTVIEPMKKGDEIPLCEMMSSYYSKEEVKKYGCVAIEISAVKGMIQ